MPSPASSAQTVRHLVRWFVHHTGLGHEPPPHRPPASLKIGDDHREHRTTEDERAGSKHAR